MRQDANPLITRLRIQAVLSDGQERTASEIAIALLGRQPTPPEWWQVATICDVFHRFDVRQYRWINSPFFQCRYDGRHWHYSKAKR